jgi:hypothetical protein
MNPGDTWLVKFESTSPWMMSPYLVTSRGQLLRSSNHTNKTRSRRPIDLRLCLCRGFEVRVCDYANSSYLLKHPIYKLEGLAPHIPDISMVGKGSKGSHDLRCWVCWLWSLIIFLIHRYFVFRRVYTP